MPPHSTSFPVDFERQQQSTTDDDHRGSSSGITTAISFSNKKTSLSLRSSSSNASIASIASSFSGRTVQFDMAATVHYTAAAAREEELREDLWYTKTEYQFIQSWNRMTLKLFATRQKELQTSGGIDIDNNDDDEDDYCLRGLEHKLPGQGRLRRDLRTTTIYAVLKEQSKLKQEQQQQQKEDSTSTNDNSKNNNNNNNDHLWTVLPSYFRTQEKLARAYVESIPSTHADQCHQRALEDQHDAMMFLVPPSSAGAASSMGSIYSMDSGSQRRSARLVPLIDTDLRELRAQLEDELDETKENSDSSDDDSISPVEITPHEPPTSIMPRFFSGRIARRKQRRQEQEQQHE